MEGCSGPSLKATLAAAYLEDNTSTCSSRKQEEEGECTHILQGWSCSGIALQHLPQHALGIGRRTDALKQGWVGFKREWGIPQQHAHHLTLVRLLVEQTLTCTEVNLLQRLTIHTHRSLVSYT